MRLAFGSADTAASRSASPSPRRGFLHVFTHAVDGHNVVHRTFAGSIRSFRVK